MNDIFGSLIDILMLGGGCYAVYTWYLIKANKALKTKLLFGNNVDVKKCKDLDGYLKYIGWKVLLFGIALIVAGAINLVNTYIVSIQDISTNIIWVILIGIVIWFMIVSSKATKKFWD